MKPQIAFIVSLVSLASVINLGSVNAQVPPAQSETPKCKGDGNDARGCGLKGGNGDWQGKVNKDAIQEMKKDQTPICIQHPQLCSNRQPKLQKPELESANFVFVVAQKQVDPPHRGGSGCDSNGDVCRRGMNKEGKPTFKPSGNPAPKKTVSGGSRQGRDKMNGGSGSGNGSGGTYTPPPTIGGPGSDTPQGGSGTRTGK